MWMSSFAIIFSVVFYMNEPSFDTMNTACLDKSSAYVIIASQTTATAQIWQLEVRVGKRKGKKWSFSFNERHIWLTFPPLLTEMARGPLHSSLHA